MTTTTNAVPEVVLVQPTNGALFSTASQVLMQADASDNDEAIQRVQFYQNNVLLGQSTNSPYRYTWNRPAVGRYALTAVAYDLDNGAKTSSPVNIIPTPGARLRLAVIS